MFSPDKWFAKPSFYNGIATQSLRFDDHGVHKLTKDFTGSSPDNNKKMTISVWAKRSNLTNGTQMVILSTYTAVRFVGELAWDSNSDSISFDPGGNGDGASNAYRVESTAQFRDPSSWYHIVLAYDSTQSTDTDRVKLYVNGTQQTLAAPSGQSFPPLNYAHEYSYSGANNEIGNYTSVASGPLNGYLSEFNFIDGVTLDPTYFGETKNGIWIPKQYTGSYGTNGYRLEFKNTTVGSGSSSTVGADTSGNDNHWTSSGFAANDVNKPDCPENNFCTLNSVSRRYGQSYMANFSQGNLTAATAGNATHVFGTMAINNVASQGGVYFEVRLDSTDGNRSYGGLVGDNGIDNKSTSANGATYHFPIKALIDLMANVRGHFGTDTDGTSTDLTSGNTGFSDGDVAGFAILSDGKFFCHRNGTYIKNASGNVGNPSTGANPVATIDLTAGDWMPYVGYNSTYTVNFGQDGSFNGNETSGGYQDANGIGDFMFAVPTNCLALCASNMAEPTIGPNSDSQADDHFNTVLYTGDGNNSRTVTGVGFQPDWLWIKRRDGTNSHVLMDSSRGSGSNDSLRVLISNVDDAEYDLNDHVRSLDSDGFTLDDDTDNTVATNNSSETYVAWSWKLNGGVTATNNQGNLTSTTQANTKSGVSIILYNGGGSAGDTIGHGLESAPTQVWFKRRGAAGDFMNYVKDMGNNGYINLSRGNGKDTGGSPVNNTDPSSTVITLGSFQSLNSGGGDADDNYIAYAFHSVDGFSKMGSYIGNNSTDGTFVYCGFRPALIILKRTSDSGGWQMLDNKRNTFNPVDNYLLPNLANSEYDGSTLSPAINVDFLSNGFKLRTTESVYNSSGGSFIFLAFAEQPFKYSNAR